MQYRTVCFCTQTLVCVQNGPLQSCPDYLISGRRLATNVLLLSHQRRQRGDQPTDRFGREVLARLAVCDAVRARGGVSPSIASGRSASVCARYDALESEKSSSDKSRQLGLPL